MSGINRNRKKLVPVDYNAMVAWLESKGRPVSIENLGGGGPHSYEAEDGVIVVDGCNKVNEEQWRRTCIAMVRDIPAERLDVTTEYNQRKDFGNPSIPVLCWALCEEIINNNQVWNY